MMLKTKNYGLPDSLIDVVKKVVQEAKLHPNQQKIDVHEPEKDKLTADDFKKLRGGKKEEAKDPIKINPKLKEEVEQMDEARSEPVDIAFERHWSRGDKTQNQLEVEHAARYKKSHGVKSKFADGPNGRTVVYSHSDPKKVKGALIKHIWSARLRKSMDASRGARFKADKDMKDYQTGNVRANYKKEEVEQVGEGSEDKKDTAKLVAMMMGKKINKPEKPKDSNVTTHTGKQTYDAGSDDEPETPKRKSGPQGPMKRRFVPKSKLRMQFK